MGSGEHSLSKMQPVVSGGDLGCQSDSTMHGPDHSKSSSISSATSSTEMLPQAPDKVEAGFGMEQQVQDQHRSRKAWNKLYNGTRQAMDHIYSRLKSTQPKDVIHFMCKPVSSKTETSTAHVSRTASYDGLRGLACLIVFNFHFLYPYTTTITHGFAAGRDGESHRFAHQLPFICLLVRGRAMVTLFFAISGYVLSYNFITSIRTHRSTHGFSRLSSLALRRWMRLFLPATISMLLAMFGAYVGAFEPGREFQDAGLTGNWEQHPPKFDSFANQLLDFVKMWWAWANVFQWRLFYSEYDPHTWTIPVEFKGSMVLFITLIAVSGLKQNWRMCAVCVVTAYCFFTQRWDVATFVGGAIVAEIHQISAQRRERLCELPMDERQITIKSRAWRYTKMMLKSILFIMALYVLSFPDDRASATPGFDWLNRITPPGYDRSYLFWHAFSALFVLWCIERLSPIRSFLSYRVPQYFGKISYGLYLVHGPLLHSAGFALQPKLFEAIGDDTRTKWVGGLVVGWMTMLSLSIVAAHMFYLLVDAPLVDVTRWLERLGTDRSDTGSGR